MALALSIYFYFEEENIVARRLKGNKDYPKKLNANCVNSSCHSAHAGEMILSVGIQEWISTVLLN